MIEITSFLGLQLSTGRDVGAADLVLGDGRGVVNVDVLLTELLYQCRPYSITVMYLNMPQYTPMHWVLPQHASIHSHAMSCLQRSITSMYLNIPQYTPMHQVGPLTTCAVFK